MQIEEKSLKVLKLSKLKNLDPVTVMIDNISKGKGKITIECFNSSWSYYWGSMGYPTLEEFFLSCDNPYLQGCLNPNISSKEYDFDNFPNYFKKLICQKRKEFIYDKEAARSLFDYSNDSFFESREDLYRFVEEIDISDLGDWESTLPMENNYLYVYFDRILDVVKEAFKKESK